MRNITKGNTASGEYDLLMALFKREWTRVLQQMRESLGNITGGTIDRCRKTESALAEIVDIIYEEMEAHHALFLQNRHAWQRLEGNDLPPFPLLIEGPRWLGTQLGPILEEFLEIDETTAVQMAALLLSTSRKLV